MPVEITIPDEDLSGFTVPARDHLKQALKSYSEELIKEANRIEASRNSAQGATEVTQGMVNDAVSSRKQMLGSAPVDIWSKIFNAVSAAVSFILGLIYDQSILLNPLYYIPFFLACAVCLVLTTVSIMKGS